MTTRDTIKLVERIKSRSVFALIGSGGSGTGEPAITPGTVAQYWRGDKTFQPLNKAAVGLSNVDNVADIDKGISTAVAGALAAKEIAANKGVAGGYAGLDGTGKVPAAQLPAFVDDVLEFANLAGFPATGSAGLIYVALDTGKIYRWSGSAYTEISPSPGSTDSVTEGATNLYFTAARVRAVVLTGLSTAVNAAIVATDTVLDALGKLQAQINTKLTSGGALGTPSSGTLTNCSGLPIASGVSGLAANVAAFLAAPNSSNMAAMLTDETGTGSNVFGTSPTLTSPILAGTPYMQQGAQTTKAAAATLTIAELLTGIIQYTGAAATLTLPTGALIDAGILSGTAVDRAFEFVVINTGTGAATLATATGLTLVGSMAVALATSAKFRVRKTAAGTFTVYRVG